MHYEDVAGVPADAVYALGAVTLGAGRLENVIRWVAADVYEYPGKNQAHFLAARIRKRAVAGNLPPHMKIDGADIIAWVDEARKALDERDKVSHSVSVKVRKGSAWEPHLVHMRSQQPTPADDAALLHLSHRLLALSDKGSQLLKGLRQSPRPGVFLPNAVVDGKWGPICDTDVGGADMARPTEAELDLWWNTLGPFPYLTA